MNSAFLAALAAAIVPLLIHLLNRRRVKTVDFSSVMFLRDLRKTRMRRLELRRWLLLAIRTLLVAAAVLAFARPALRGNGLAAVGSRARTSAVIALDRSASMALETENGTAYERALGRVREIGGVMGDGDEAIGLPFDGDPSPVPEPATTDIAGLTRRLTSLPVGHGATDAGAATGKGLAALRGATNLNRELYLVTDLNRSGFTRTVVPPPEPGQKSPPTIFVVDVAEPGGFDLGVSGIELASQLLDPGSPLALIATIANHTDRSVDRLLVSLFIDGRRVAQQDAALGAGQSATVAFTAAVPAAGVHTGFVEISADDNPLNDRRYFAVTIPDRIRVLLASDYPSGRVAASLALVPRPLEQTRLALDAIDTGELPRRNLFDYDAILITEWRRPDRLSVDQLLRYVRAGGGVFIAPSIDADTTSWNSLIAGPLFGLRLGPNPEPPSADHYFVWERFDWAHPIWTVYGDVPRDRIPEIRWFSVFRTEGQPGGNAIVDFSGGRPSISETKLESGKCLVSWAPINAPFTDLPLRSIFVPLAHRLVEYLAADVSERRSDFLVGERVTCEPAPTPATNAVWELVRPDGSVVRPGVEQIAARTRITYDGCELPGVYTVVAGDHRIDAFAVNVDPDEMVATPISHEELSRRLAGYQVVFVAPGEPLGEVVTRTRYGTEIRPAFLWIVAALFFLEMWVARTRRRDLPQAEHAPAGTDALHPHPAG
ncbi:MAG: BatA domain-containing protein [Candidatus Zixiibacteriota bacterium]